MNKITSTNLALILTKRNLQLLTKIFLLISIQIWFGEAIAKNVCYEKQIKIIAIGDSVTQGGGKTEEYTYRLPLSKMLKEAGYDVDFIGAQHSGLNKSFKWPANFDNDHEGFYGETASSVEHSLRLDLAKLPPPDFALIHLGVGGLGSFNVIKPVVLPMRSIITQLRNKNPKVHILISQLHLNGYQAWYVRLHLISLAMLENSAKSPVITVPHYIGWTAKDTIDGMHPSISGQKKMAKAWFDNIDLLCNGE